MSESKIMRDIRLAIGGRSDCRLLRNNVAQGVVGEVKWVRQRATVEVFPGDAIVRHARVLHAGLATGSSDLIGPRRTLITPEMVGRSVGVLVGLEVKDETGRQSPEQIAWERMLLSMGCLAGVVRSVEDAVRIVDSI